MDFLDDAIDFISEIPDHLVDLPSTIAEFFGSMFENLGEFSVIGLALGIIGFIFVYALREYMLYPFLVHMGGFAATFWGFATYAGTFCGAYLLGKHFENTG